MTTESRITAVDWLRAAPLGLVYVAVVVLDRSRGTRIAAATLALTAFGLLVFAAVRLAA
jgi:hypothetical protein